MIDVSSIGDDKFTVVVKERDSRAEYTVTLDDEYYRNLKLGGETKEKLIERSFQFLLEREPKESILSKFDLRIIGRYFHEYESEIKRV